MIDISIWQAITLATLGLVAGVINTLAGGGSNLTVPALMVLGMPADIANATNRVGVIMQGIVGTVGFKKHNKLPTHDIIPILIPSMIGGLFGALLAAYAPQYLLKYLLLATMVTMALIILIRPSIIAPPLGTPSKKVLTTPVAWWGLMIAGFYGGFVQAGVGFVLITAFAGTLRYDLVRANALKIVCTTAFTAVALAIFIYNDQVRWVPGLILAAGTMIGAHIGVKLALNISQTVLKWFLLIMTICASVAALYL